MRAPEVKNLVDLLEARLNNLNTMINRLEVDCKGNSSAHAELRRELDQSLPRMQEVLEELKKWRDDEAKEIEGYVHLKRDVGELKKWQGEQEEEAKDRKNWYRSFGPGLLTSIIAMVVNFIVLGINLYFTYWVKKPTP